MTQTPLPVYRYSQRSLHQRSSQEDCRQSPKLHTRHRLKHQTLAQQCRHHLQRPAGLISAVLVVLLLGTMVTVSMLPDFAAGDDRQAHMASAISPQMLLPLALKRTVAAVLAVKHHRELNAELMAHLCRQPMLGEIIVWNNNVARPLSLQCPPIKIHNSMADFQTAGRFMACAQLSSLPFCFLQENMVAANGLVSAFVNFHHAPHLIHLVGDENAYARTTWDWTFFSNALSLHTAYAPVGAGMFVQRSMVQQCLAQLQRLRVSATEFANTEHFFTLLQNQLPFSLSTSVYIIPAPPIDANVDDIDGKTVEHTQIDARGHVFSGMQYLLQELETANDGTGRHKNQTLSALDAGGDRWIRSPCQSDTCLFFTSQRQFIQQQALAYTADMDLDAVEQAHQAIQSGLQFRLHPYHHAVDDRPETYWRSRDFVQRNDFVGLDLLQVRRVQVHITIDAPRSFFDTLRIETSVSDVMTYSALDATYSVATEQWQCNYVKRPFGVSHAGDVNQELAKNDVLRVEVTEGDFLVHCFVQLEARLVRFVTTRSWMFPFKVYDVTAIDL